MRRITQHSEDNTIPNLVHAERPADSEARILEMAQALNIISPEALEPVIKSRDSKVEFISSIRIGGPQQVDIMSSRDDCDKNFALAPT